uniref:Transposase MuDR plant domain-containing protein n=1 Tax=Aegilops tauschii subsp. strangulata TaxID=200361 RepID=A0A453ET83_AEGTS
MLVEVHTKPAKKSVAKRANKPTKEPAAKKPKKAPVEKAPKILKSAMDDVLCSATSSVVVDNANEEALEVVQSMASQTSAFVDNDINFTACDVVQPNMPSISDIAESNEQCGSSVVLDIEPPIDWSLIEIAPPNEDEVDVPVTEENMCDFLGIEEDETHEAPSSPPSEDAYLTDEEDQQLLTEAAIPVDDKIAQEEEIAYDKENPHMYVGALFPSMEEFKMAIKQYAINNEIDIWGYKTDKKRYLGQCRGIKCPWRITARLRADEKTIRVTK